ncbi:MBOAT family protein [Phanerochaete sordida]|uniref:MBOAT family protein n=1 Tax=Phanerochaete sordida TaxID=48140 RepID=A0A9P3L817_9APHY|nr:MBOAT family protein [Phanerochaete sordida]
MVWLPVKLSNPSHPNYHIYAYKLSHGWLFGRQVDDSDAQYHSFRGNVPVLAAVVALFLSLKAAYARLRNRASANASESRLHVVPFMLSFSAVFLLALHGTSILKIFGILAINYAISKYLGGSRLNPLLTWLFNGTVLFTSELYSGYHFGSLHATLGALDGWQGIYPRWYITFNITMLRLISFNMDYYWACSQKPAPHEAGEPSSHKERTNIAHSPDMYSFTHYLAYSVYSPLYIGGPIVTFNDFMWQLRKPLNISAREIAGYAARFASCLLTMEFVLHYMYVVAIKDTAAWYGDSVAELSMVGFWNLIIVWLKLLIPWRFFRLWALLDGIDPPENMVRCMANNYSALGFWRSWHRSYNLWIVRYIYIPLGGTKNLKFTTVLVFSFVALWHDLSFRLLAWGWLVSLFILPEIAARYFFTEKAYGDRWWYRHVCAIGGIFNILMMMTANLVGFVIGTEGVSYLLGRIVSGWEGVQFVLFTCFCLFVAVQVMFEYREEEMRQGIYRRC